MLGSPSTTVTQQTPASPASTLMSVAGLAKLANNSNISSWLGDQYNSLFPETSDGGALVNPPSMSLGSSAPPVQELDLSGTQMGPNMPLMPQYPSAADLAGGAEESGNTVAAPMAATDELGSTGAADLAEAGNLGASASEAGSVAGGLGEAADLGATAAGIGDLGAGVEGAADVGAAAEGGFDIGDALLGLLAFKKGGEAHSGLGTHTADNGKPVLPGTIGNFHSEGNSAFPGPHGLIKGNGGGREDEVKADLSDGEWVGPADFVSALGGGDNTEGANKLDQMVMNVRKTGLEQPLPQLGESAQGITLPAELISMLGGGSYDDGARQLGNWAHQTLSSGRAIISQLPRPKK